MTDRKRLLLVAVLPAVASLVGLGWTMRSMLQSITAVGMTDPSEKSRVLTENINSAMVATYWSLALALVLSVVALVVFVTHVLRNEQLSAAWRGAWILAMLVFSWMAMVVYALVVAAPRAAPPPMPRAPQSA